MPNLRPSAKGFASVTRKPRDYLLPVYVLDADHNPVALDLADPQHMAMWSAFMFDGESNRRVAWDRVTKGIAVSTVFIGIDHGFAALLDNEVALPMVFETMVFDADADDDGNLCYLYATWAEAEVGHARVVAEIRERLKAVSDDSDG